MTVLLFKRPKRAHGAGNIEFRSGHYWVRPLLADGTRPRLRLCGDVCRCLEMSEARIAETAAAVSERERARVAKQIDESAARIPARVTVQKFGEEWTSGKLAERWPDHVKDKRTKMTDRSRLEAHVYPVVGNVAIVDFTLDDAERVMRKLPASLSPASRRQVAQLMHRLLTMAVYPARLRADNPLPRGFLPKVPKSKEFPYLYPKEEAQFLACRAVDLGERVFFGFLAREGMRASEALELTWEAIDLAHGTVRLERTKTDEGRAWALGADVVEALTRWRALQGNPEGGRVFTVPHGHHLADRFRDALRLAGLKRLDLGLDDDSPRTIRAHDLRASFITLALAIGKTEAWVTDRTGHTSSAMIYRYKRAARLARELDLGWFAPMHETIPELKELDNVRTLTRSSS